MGAVAKSYMRKGFLTYEEIRKYLNIYEEAVSHILLCYCSLLNFLIYDENFIIFFISVVCKLNTIKHANLQRHKQSDQTDHQP